MKKSFYSESELKNMGFKRIGKNCLISRFSRFYGIENVELGDNVRIDDFCIFSGKINLGSFIHVSAHCLLYGSQGISLGDFSGLSPNTVIFSAMDDFSGKYLINPMVDKQYTNVTGGSVIIEKYVQLGVNTVVFPNLNIGEGVVTGALTLVNNSLDSWYIYVGTPAKPLRKRKKVLLKYIKEIKKNIRDDVQR